MNKKIKKILYITSSLILLFILLISFSESGAFKYKLCRLKAEKIVSSLTLEEKIGQMIMPSARKWSDSPNDESSYQDMVELRSEVADAISEYNLCGICLFGQNCKNTEQLVQLTYDLQEASSKSSSGIPLFISVDQEGGYITRLYEGTSLIGNMALAATGDSKNAKIEAEIISSELKALGINLDFAPVSDVNDNPQNPVIGIRAFSDNADIVSEYAGSFIKGLHKNGIVSSLKHFPGHGNTSTDSHTGLPLVDKSLFELQENELKPFLELAKDTDMIMTAHIQYPQIENETYTSISSGEEVYYPATMSKTIIKGILRDYIGFEGVVVSDALEMDAISENFEFNDAIKNIINADVDLILMPFDLTDTVKIDSLKTMISDIEIMIQNGDIEESEIDDSVTRIITLKLERGILDNEKSIFSSDAYKLEALDVVGCEEHHEIEWKLAQKCITLYKDENNSYSNGVKDNETILYLYPTSSQSLSLDLAIQKLESDGFSADKLSFEKLCYNDMTFSDIQDEISKYDRIILVTKTSSLSSLDMQNSNNLNAAFCKSTIKEANELGIEIDVISSMLPYDAEFYLDADIILLAYNPIGVNSLPQDSSSTISYGVNIPAAIASLLTGRTLTGSCPVIIDNIQF